MKRTDRIVRFTCGILAIMGLSACQQRVGDLTFVSTKNIDFTDFRLDSKMGTRTQGKDCKWVILGVPTGVPNLKDAVDDALVTGNGVVLIDEVTRVETTPMIIAAKSCIIVEGTALNPIKTIAPPVAAKAEPEPEKSRRRR